MNKVWLIVKEEDILMDLGLALDCLDTCLMYGDYINDTNEDFDYWSY